MYGVRKTMSATDPTLRPGQGTLGPRVKDVQDGLSKTLHVGERCGAVDRASALAGRGSFAAAWAGNGLPNNGTSRNGAGKCLGRTAGPGYPLPSSGSAFLNDYTIDPSTNNPKYSGKFFNSAHPGGVSFVKADGSVIFLLDSIDALPLCHLAARADGKTSE